MKTLLRWIRQMMGKDEAYKDPVIEEIHYNELFNNKEFNEWAFGKNYKIYNFTQKVDKWNLYHGELTMFYPAENRVKVFHIIEQFWLNARKAEHEKAVEETKDIL